MKLQKLDKEMLMATDKNWQNHFQFLMGQQCQSIDIVVPTIQHACQWLLQRSDTIRRQTLQTRFFEVCDNYYLGMEMTREFTRWKKFLARKLTRLVACSEQEREHLKKVLMGGIDRLWYENCLETIRTGDVYNPGARRRVPRLYLINSRRDVSLGDLPVGESFRISDNEEDRFEILVKKSSEVIVRNLKGLVSKLSPGILVRREGNLTRTPDGNSESKVSIATFPVSHFVNHRTMHRNETHKDFAFAFIGDEQATPHFMRYRYAIKAQTTPLSANTKLLLLLAADPTVV